MDHSSRSPQLHPLMIAAAISVILLSAIGIAAMTGLLPKVKSTEATPAAVVAGKTETRPLAPAPVLVEKTEAASPKPVVHHAEHRSTVYREKPIPVCYDCGTVTGVNAVVVQGNTSGVGAVGGAVVGGVAGHQFGGGKGRDAMTVVGAIGGALAGNQIEKSQRKTTRYDVDVRMEDGSRRTFSYNTIPTISSGDRVRVSGGELIRN